MTEQTLPATIRINHKPIILYGLNGSELSTIAWLSALIGIALGVLSAGLAGAMPLFLIFGLLWGIVISIILGSWLRKQKRQKPDGYYIQKLFRFMDRPSQGLINVNTSFDYLRHSYGSKGK